MNCPRWVKRILTIKTIMRGWHKLELWIFGRTGKDLRGTLLRSSKSENDDEKYHQNYWDTPEQWIIEMMNQRWKNLKDLGERHMTDDNPFLRQTLKRILEAPGKLEDSGKILGKDLWVRAHSKGTPLEWFKRKIASVELIGLNERTSLKDLERMQSGNTNLRDILSTPE